MKKPFTELVGTKWPIAVMAMNQVSDVNLAVACANAGILPSLSIFNYYIAKNAVVDTARLVNDLNLYNEATNSAPLLFSISVDVLIQDKLYKIVNDANIKIFELINDSPNEQEISIERDLFRNKRIKELRDNGCLVFVKSLGFGDELPLGAPLNNERIESQYEVDGYILKSNAGAGRTIPNALPAVETIVRFREMLPKSILIINGGIGNAQQVKECLDAGADAVGLGTIFAASAESSLSDAAKQKMVEANSSDIRPLQHRAKQNALIFSELAEDHFNNTKGLILGKKTGLQGHIFAGKGIGDIDAVKPVAQIVSELTSLI